MPLKTPFLEDVKQATVLLVPNQDPASYCQPGNLIKTGNCNNNQNRVIACTVKEPKHSAKNQFLTSTKLIWKIALGAFQSATIQLNNNLCTIPTRAAQKKAPNDKIENSTSTVRVTINICNSDTRWHNFNKEGSTADSGTPGAFCFLYDRQDSRTRAAKSSRSRWGNETTSSNDSPKPSNVARCADNYLPKSSSRHNSRAQWTKYRRSYGHWKQKSFNPLKRRNSSIRFINVRKLRKSSISCLCLINAIATTPIEMFQST